MPRWKFLIVPLAAYERDVLQINELFIVQILRYSLAGGVGGALLTAKVEFGEMNRTTWRHDGVIVASGFLHACCEIRAMWVAELSTRGIYSCETPPHFSPLVILGVFEASWMLTFRRR